MCIILSVCQKTHSNIKLELSSDISHCLDRWLSDQSENGSFQGQIQCTGQTVQYGELLQQHLLRMVLSADVVQ